MALVDRAAKAGFDTLLVTVDVPVAGARLRDVRNGMTIPPKLTAKTVVNAIPRPAWWFNFLTTEPLAFASLDSWSGTVADLLDTMFDPTVTFEDLAWIRDQWPGKISVKGVQSRPRRRPPRRRRRRRDHPVQPRRPPARPGTGPVPPAALGRQGGRLLDLEVHLDTGIMSGQDIVAAIAHGARFTLIGRAYLYGLMAGGREGVDRTIEILTGQIERTMRLLGVTTLDELEPEHVGSSCGASALGSRRTPRRRGGRRGDPVLVLPGSGSQMPVPGGDRRAVDGAGAGRPPGGTRSGRPARCCP